MFTNAITNIYYKYFLQINILLLIIMITITIIIIIIMLTIGDICNLGDNRYISKIPKEDMY